MNNFAFTPITIKHKYTPVTPIPSELSQYTTDNHVERPKKYQETFKKEQNLKKEDKKISKEEEEEEEKHDDQYDDTKTIKN